MRKVPKHIPFCIMAYGNAKLPAPTVAAISDIVEPCCPPGLSLKEAYLTGSSNYTITFQFLLTISDKVLLLRLPLKLL